jgi:hypothetical protein
MDMLDYSQIILYKHHNSANSDRSYDHNYEYLQKWVPSQWYGWSKGG